MKKWINYVIYYQSIIIFNLYFCISSTAISSQHYENIFTQDIYDQDKILARLKVKIDKGVITDEQIDNELVAHFFHTKEILLARRCFARIEDQIKALRKIHNQAEKREFWESVLENVKKGFSLVGGIAGILTPVGEIIGKSIAELLCLPFSLLTEHKIREKFSPESASSINKEIRDLENEIYNIKSRIEREPIRELEIAYIKQKRKIQDNILIQEIEESLIEARRSTYLTGTITQFIKLALSLPVESKILFSGLSGNRLRRTISDEFDSNFFFESFQSVVKTALLDIITQTVIDSQIKNLPNNTSRKTYFFWGAPSSGKTEASIKIAEFLGLPYFQMTIRSLKDLEQENLEGSERMWQNDKVGALIRPLIEPLENKSFRNGFLILNDLHTILSKDNPEAATAALAFLLDYLDPKKGKFYSPYFKTYIDISQLNIIITSNEEIEENILYQALKSRIFQFIEFPKFSDEKIKKILDNDLQQLSAKHKVPNGLRFSYLDPTKLEIDCEHTVTQEDGSTQNFLEFISSVTRINTLTRTYYTFSTDIPEKEKETVTLRFLKSRMENSINRFMRELTQKSIKWLQESERIYRQDKRYSLRLCKMSSIAGHEEAHYKLGEEYRKSKQLNEALISYEQAARSGHAAAAEWLGRIFWSLDRKELAEIWIKESILLGSELNISWFCAQCAMLPDKQQTQKHLLDILQKYPNNPKIVEALYLLGENFMANNLLEEAYECYSVIARHGEGKGLYKFAEASEKSKGLGNDEAMKYFEEAASQGHAPSQFKMGWFHFTLDKKLSKKERNKKAFEWLSRPAANQTPETFNLLGVLYLEGIEDFLAQDFEKAREHYMQAQENCIHARFNLGVLYYYGIGVPRNNGTASNYFDLVSEFIQPIMDDFNRNISQVPCFRKFFSSRSECKYFGADIDIAHLASEIYQLGSVIIPKNMAISKKWREFSRTHGNVRIEKEPNNRVCNIS